MVIVAGSIVLLFTAASWITELQHIASLAPDTGVNIGVTPEQRQTLISTTNTSYGVISGIVILITGVLAYALKDR